MEDLLSMGPTPSSFSTYLPVQVQNIPKTLIANISLNKKLRLLKKKNERGSVFYMQFYCNTDTCENTTLESILSRSSVFSNMDISKQKQTSF